jgi:hypothetical protein
VDFEDGGDAPFAGFKTASELENVGGKNEEWICGLLGRCTADSANRKKMVVEIWGFCCILIGFWFGVLIICVRTICTPSVS